MDDQFAFLPPVIMVTFDCAFLIAWSSGVRAAGSWGIGYFFAGVACAAPISPARLADDAVTILTDRLFAAAF